MKSLVKKSVKDLLKELSKEKAKLQDLRFKSAGTRLKDDKAMRELRKKIARIMTAINNKK